MPFLWPKTRQFTKPYLDNGKTPMQNSLPNAAPRRSLLTISNLQNLQGSPFNLIAFSPIYYSYSHLGHKSNSHTNHKQLALVDGNEDFVELPTNTFDKNMQKRMI